MRHDLQRGEMADNNTGCGLLRSLGLGFRLQDCVTTVPKEVPQPNTNSTLRASPAAFPETFNHPVTHLFY
jgi:hypothetical protein